MRFDVFEKLGPGFFGKRNKERSSPKPESARAPGGRPAQAHMCYVVTEDAVTVDQALGGSTCPAFRALDRHARWIAVHQMTHSTRTQ
jgi:hypothetical protein